MKNFLLSALLTLMTFSVFAQITVNPDPVVFGDTPVSVSVTYSSAPAGTVHFFLYTNLVPTTAVFDGPTTAAGLGGASQTITFTVGTIGSGADAEIDPATGQLLLFFGDSSDESTAVPTGDVSITAILPIELKSFNAKSQENNVNLSWTTSMEENNDFFTLERSFDGKDFAAVTKINGAGDSAEEVAYNFTDENVTRIATANTAYYRLKQTDFDGTATFSDVISVNLENRNDLELTNVAVLGNELSVNFVSPTEGDTEISVYDLTGRMIATNNQVATEGYNTTNLTLNTNQTGIFIVRIANGQSQTVRKIMK